MTDEHIPELLLSTSVDSTLRDLGIFAWCILFSILLDPESDDEYKHSLASLSGTIVSQTASGSHPTRYSITAMCKWIS